MVRERIDVETETLEHNQITRVQMTAAAVGGGIAESVSHRVARFIGGELHAFGVDGIFLAAEALAHPFAAVRD